MELTGYLEELRAYLEERRFAGYDPYDALNSPILRALSGGWKWGRITCTQMLRRLPFNPRPVLLIRPGENAKGLALCLAAYARLHRHQSRDEYADAAAYLIRRLQCLRTRTAHGHGWGYNFDWQSRAFFLPKSTPTVVCSSFVAHALLDAAEVFGSDEARQLAVPAGDFFLGDLHRLSEGDFFCFSYSAHDHYAVHNANLLGASVLIRLGRLTGSRTAKEAALAAIAYTVKHQREDGSWRYSEADTAHWVDSFHTGFNLECIRRFLDAGEVHCHRPAYERGVRFYAERFFLPDGTPKYYANRTYPIDIHSAATAISFFADEGEPYLALTKRVLAYAIRYLWDERGFFYYQKRPNLLNRIPYMRWGQAWMFRALAGYATRRMPELRSATAVNTI